MVSDKFESPSVGIPTFQLCKDHPGSHRDRAALETCAIPVGAVLPAKRPARGIKKARVQSAGFSGRADAYAAFASCWLSERFKALNSALKLAVVMFSSIPTPCTGRPPATRSSM